ncbi:MAG TPA: hypothetical protein VGS60_14540 [Actinomycetes bacterium]|nr:hypothetical protein [Actinomycetes bacterium]
MALARSDGPEQRVLPGPLGDRDRECVEDDERADEECDHGEDQHERVEERQVTLDVVLALFGDLVARHHLDTGRHRRANPVREFPLRHALIGHRGDAVELPRLGDELLSGVGGEEHIGGTARTVRVPKFGDTGELQVLRWALGQHGYGVAYVEARIVGTLLVDDDLIVGAGWPPRHDHERVEIRGLIPVAPKGRRAGLGVAHRVAVLVDDAGVALDDPLGRRHPVDPSDGVDERRVDSSAHIASTLGVAEGGLLTGYGVGALVDVSEQVVEGLADGVSKHERARHEGDAEHYRQCGDRQAGLVCEKSLDGDPEHADQSSNFFRRSSTVAEVGFGISSTSLPSARNSTRSA